MRMLIPLLLATGCATGSAAPSNQSARAELRSAEGQPAGRVTISEMHGGLHVRIEAGPMGEGRYGAHLHGTGRCAAPGFESAGPHWNPTTRQHGTENPLGHHLGDLPNLAIGGESRRGELEFHVPGATLHGPNGLLDADGASVVIHAAPDDYRTDPSGNSGARIACGVLR